MVTRHKPSKAQRAATRPANDEDYEKLAQAVVQALVQRKKDVILKLPYFVQMSDDFPKGILIKKTSEHNFYKAKVIKLANFLNKHGYLAQDAKGVVKSMRSVSNLVGEIERLVANPAETLYNSSSEIGEENDCQIQVFER